MAEPFTRHSPSESGLAALLGRRVRRTAVRELEATLARAKRLRDVSVERVHELSETHGIDLRDRLRTPRRNLYRRFLEHCLLDCTLSEDESEELAHLRRLLHLDDGDVVHVHDVVAREVYGAAIEEVLEDHKLDEDEENFLRRLRTELGVSDADASRMYEQEARKAQQRLLSSSPNLGGFLAARDGMVELKGASTIGLQEAVQTVVDESCHALPHLSWAELSEVRVRIESGHIAEWQIKLKAGLKTPAAGSSQDPSPDPSQDPPQDPPPDSPRVN